MRVFLPHRESNNQLSKTGNNDHNSVHSSPLEDPNKRRKSIDASWNDERKIAAKKQRVVKQHSTASSTSATSQSEAETPPTTMGGGGKLFPLRNERELLEVKKRGNNNHDDHHRNTAPNNANAAAAAVDRHVTARGQSPVVRRASMAAVNPSRRHSKLPSSADEGGRGRFKSECDNHASIPNPAREGDDWIDDGNNDNNHTISVSAEGGSATCVASPFASSPFKSTNGADDVYSGASAAAASSTTVAIAKSTRHRYDPAMISTHDNEEDDDDDDDDLSQFAHLLRTTHIPPLEITPMQGDGNCLFRAISLQVYGSEDMHSTVRTQCLDFMEMEEGHFQDFVAEPYRDYIHRKRCEGVHGNHAEIQAMSELYNRRIEVYVPPKLEPMNIFQQEEETTAQDNEGSGAAAAAANIVGTINPPIRLLYMDGNHYDALIDPLIPTAGLGLGLPGLQPGLADRLQLDQAKRESNQIIQGNMERKLQLALEESKRLHDNKEKGEIERVLRESCVGLVGGSVGGTYRTEREEVEDAFEKKALYLSEIEAADFDLEQAVLASSLESYRKAEQERKLPSSSSGRRGESAGRRGRYNPSPNYSTSRNQRSCSNSPVHRTASATSATTEPSYPASFSSSPSHYASSYPYSAAATSAASAAAASSVASFPGARSSSPANYYDGSAAASASASIYTSADEYPSSVQELVMNGFQLSKVLHAYDLIGDNFDDLLSFLLSSTS